MKSELCKINLTVTAVVIFCSLGCGIKGRPLPPVQQPIFEQQSISTQTQPQATQKPLQKLQSNETDDTKPKEKK